MKLIDLVKAKRYGVRYFHDNISRLIREPNMFVVTCDGKEKLAMVPYGMMVDLVGELPAR